LAFHRPDIGYDGTKKRRQLEMHVQMAVIATIRQLIVEGSKRDAPTSLRERRNRKAAENERGPYCAKDFGNGADQRI
jgi:hypothetical protein